MVTFITGNVILLVVLLAVVKILRDRSKGIVCSGCPVAIECARQKGKIVKDGRNCKRE